MLESNIAAYNSSAFITLLSELNAHCNESNSWLEFLTCIRNKLEPLKIEANLYIISVSKTGEHYEWFSLDDEIELLKELDLSTKLLTEHNRLVEEARKHKAELSKLKNPALFEHLNLSFLLPVFSYPPFEFVRCDAMRCAWLLIRVLIHNRLAAQFLYVYFAVCWRLKVAIISSSSK